MKLLWLYLFAYLILPIIGELSIYITGIHISAGAVTYSLIINNIIFVVIIIISAYLVQNYRSINISLIRDIYSYRDVNRIFKSTIILLLLCSFIIFTLGGYKILLDLANRGEIRISLGVFGPLYTFALSYLPVVLIIYSSVVYIHSSKKVQKKLKKKLILIYVFAVILGIFSGYKSVALELMIPGFVVLFVNNFNIFKMLMFIFFSFIILTIFTAFVRHEDVVSSFYFLIYRMTTMTAYGTIGVWNQFPHGVSLTDVFINFTGMLGQKLSSFLLGLSPHDPEFLKTDLSRLITYIVYPNTEGALSGTVNVTVTNFGHAIYIFGRTLYIFYAFIVGLIIGLVIRAYKKYIVKGYPLKASLTGLYFFAVIIPSINSGGLFKLFSLPVFIYFLLSYIVIITFLKRYQIINLPKGILDENIINNNSL